MRPLTTLKSISTKLRTLSDENSPPSIFSPSQFMSKSLSEASPNYNTFPNYHFPSTSDLKVNYSSINSTPMKIKKNLCSTFDLDTEKYSITEESNSNPATSPSSSEPVNV